MSGVGRKDTGVGPKSRYQSLNLSQSYKGNNEFRSGQKRGSMQSLGKFNTSRRMPAPAQLRSLKSSNEGNDPTINLVPQGGGGWSKDEEKEKEKEKGEEKKVSEKKGKKQESQVETRVPEGFHTDFPSLKEQEKMSKKEKEELERQQRGDDIEKSDEEIDHHSPPHHHPPHNAPRDPRGSEYGWGGHEPPPFPPGPVHNFGPRPPPPRSSRGGGHMYYHHPPHRPGMYHPDYGPYPPNVRYPIRPPPSSHPTTRHRQLPYSPNPYEMHYDPYQLSPRERERNHSSKRDGTGRPPTVKEDDLRQMELHEEDDEGWAGYQEEVDYTKEVVFEDSSDEDVPKRHQEPNRKQNKENYHSNEKDPTEDIIDHRGMEGRRTPPPSRRSSQPGYPQGGPPSYYHYNEYHYPLSHPPPPPNWYPPYPPRGNYSQGPPLKHRRTTNQMEEKGGRNKHDFHPHWEPEESHWHKRRGSHTRDEERRGQQQYNVHVLKSERNDEFHTSHDSRPVPKPVDSPDENQETNYPVVPHSPDSVEPLSPLVTVSHVRNYPKKIMMRDLAEKSSEGGRGSQGGNKMGEGSGSGDKNNLDPSQGFSKPKVAWNPVVTSLPLETSEPEAVLEPQNPISIESWNMNERGPIMTPKTLYEPEGRTGDFP